MTKVKCHRLETLHPLTMARDQIPADVRALIQQAVSSLENLVPPSAAFDDETQDAVFGAIDAIDGDMLELNKAIHGACVWWLC